MPTADDGSKLLASSEIEDLLVAAVEHAGGQLGSWRLEHIDANPGNSTTATYQARVLWPYGIRNELIGVSARASGPSTTDSNAEIFADGSRAVAVWLYPFDPDLPGLATAAYQDKMADVLNEAGLFNFKICQEDLELAMIGYRPRRRAVLKLTIKPANTSFFVKVMRGNSFNKTVVRHNLLVEAGIPAPKIFLATRDNLMIMQSMPGRPLTEAIFDPQPPVSAQALVELLDQMPPSVAGLDRRPAWSAGLAHYAAIVSHALPEEAKRLQWLTETISQGLKNIPPGDEPTHGDFHEGQIFVSHGKISGLIDVDTIGPGRRADDFACMIAHLSTIQKMTSEQTDRLHRVIREWTPVFDLRVDPFELRLRSAAVILSLATGPYRNQEPGWQGECKQMIDSAQALVRQVL